MSNQKQVLSFFNNLFDTIITENNNNNNNNNNNDDDGDEDNSVEENEEENEDDEDKDEEYYKIKQLNDYFKMIDDSKSFIDWRFKVIEKNEFYNFVLEYEMLMMMMMMMMMMMIIKN